MQIYVVRNIAAVYVQDTVFQYLLMQSSCLNIIMINLFCVVQLMLVECSYVLMRWLGMV